MRESVVVLSCSQRSVLTDVNIVEWHRVLRLFKGGRFIHVVPHAINACSHKVFVECSPPSTNIGTREVGEVAQSWPYFPFKGTTVSCLHPIITSRSLVIDEVSRFHFHTRVNHIDSLEIVFVKIGIQSLRLRKLTWIESKDTVAIHIVDIHPDDIRGDAMLTQ